MRRVCSFIYPLVVCAAVALMIATATSFEYPVEVDLSCGEFGSGGFLLSASGTLAEGWISSDLRNTDGGGSYMMGDEWWGSMQELLRTPEGRFWYVARIPAWEPIVILSLWPTWRTAVMVRRRWRGKAGPSCSKCGYNLTGNTSGVCPECGERTPVETGSGLG